MAKRRVSYDAVAPTYDRRYARTDYVGVERALLEMIGDAPRRVLEVGCGTGRWLALLAERGAEVAGIDPSEGMLERARQRLPGFDLRLGSAESLPWPDRSFDRVICVNALHHFVDAAVFFAEAARVLRPGGAVWTCGLDPHAGTDRWFIYDFFVGALERDRARYSATGRIREMMVGAGFAECATSAVQRFPVEMPVDELLASGEVDRHVTSQLSLLTDEEYARGIAKLEALAARAEETGEAIVLGADLTLYATIGWRGGG